MRGTGYAFAFILFWLAAVTLVILAAFDDMPMILALFGALFFFVVGVIVLIDWKGKK